MNQVYKSVKGFRMKLVIIIHTLSCPAWARSISAYNL